MAQSPDTPGKMPVAIVGIGCRFPGGATDAASFWRLLVEGRDAIAEIPSDRFDLARYFDPRPATRGRVMTRWGGFLERLDEFDAGFFGMSPREAERLDPQQRLLMEAAWEAIEDGGLDASRLVGSTTGVFVGQWLSDFEARLFADPEAVDFYMTTGSGRYASSGRISYALGLRGPSLTLDTACSSSLAAVHLAVKSIRAGESTLALAGGANVILQPHISVAYSQSRMMAPDGHCKFGDAKGDGYVRSEGAALVLLKPLDAAIAAGDRIYAVIRGSAVNNDGRSSGSMGTPSRVGQEELLRAAYADAEVAPSRVGYVEAHGTGTRAGDPVELGALGAVLSQGRAAGERAYVGSVKTNIGHTEGAAGVAGLVKVALAMHHGRIPRSLHCNELNPNIPWAEAPYAIPREGAVEWPGAGGTRVGGVSAFGIAGTNAHVVLEQAPAAAQSQGGARTLAVSRLLPLSARSPEALRALAGRYADLLSADDAPSVGDVGWSAATRRTPLDHRAAFVADDRATMVEALRTYASGAPAPVEGVVDEAVVPRVVFVFPGQGSQWVGMGRELMAGEPVFREAIEACDAAARPFIDWSIVEQLGLAAEDPKWRLDRIDVIQPVLVAVEIAFARLWMAMGLEPFAVVGHSMGEVAAAHVAGVLDLPTAMRIICRRSILMAKTSGQGAMAQVELSMEQAQARLAGRESKISVAVSNAPGGCVVSGDPAEVEAFVLQLERENVFARLVNVDVASHSPQMEPIARELRAELEGMKAHEARVPIYSTVLARKAGGSEFVADYWARNMRQPVWFAKAVERLLEDGATTFVEMSPHPLLMSSVAQVAKSVGKAAAGIGSARRAEPARALLLRAVGALFAAGVAVDWQRAIPRGRRADLPHYPWQRQRYWCDEANARSHGVSSEEEGRGVPHPFLSRMFKPAGRPGTSWEGSLSPAGSWLGDHRVRGSVIFPAAAYCEAALAAARESRPNAAWALADVEFVSAWMLPESARSKLQVELQWSSEREGRFEIHGLAGGESSEGWALRASGRVVAASEAMAAAEAWANGEETSRDEVYERMAGAGLDYGPAFRTLQGLARTPERARATVRLDAERLDPAASRFFAYPPALDGVLQVMAAALCAEGDSTPLPTTISRLDIPSGLPLDRALEVTLEIASRTATAATADLSIHADGRCIGRIAGVGFTMARQGRAVALDEMLHAPEWVAVNAAAATQAPGPVVVIAQSEAAARPLLTALAAKKIEAVHLAGSNLDVPQLRDRIAAVAKQAGSARVQVVHLGALEAPAPAEGLEWIEQSWRAAGDSALALAQALSGIESNPRPRVWLVTRNAQATGHPGDAGAPGGAPLWGLGRVWAHEQPELDVTLVDLDASGTSALVPLLAAAPAERQLAIRGEALLALRLPRLASAATPAQSPPSWRATMTAPGVPDSLLWQSALRPAPAPHEVEIEVEATGLNFMNLMSVLGVLPGYDGGHGPLGIECAGRVARVGSAVTHLKAGQEVVAIAPDCLRRHALAHGALVRPRPAKLSLEHAAGMPIAFLTAWYALVHQARLSKGERVLVHSAAGGVGLAALQIARSVGAEVIATAGTEDKRALLRSMGVAHVLDSRSLEFSARALALTGGQGVDVVMNSLAGEAIAAGIRCLAPYGRFVELGKRDIYGGTAIGLKPFQKNLSYFAVDLDRMMRERPEALGRMLADVMAQFESGAFEPLPVRAYGANELAQSFRDLMPGTHVGKHVVSLARAPSTIHAAPGMHATVRADATYLVTGGLGALGLELARWLARRGAGCVALVGRSAPSAEAKHAIAAIEASGTRVLTAACDVADRAALAKVLERIRREAPPLRGVFHAAGVLADAMLTDLTPESLRAPRDAKVLGAWNLDRATAGDALDHFVLFSSVASLFGTRGQGNYAAANAFLDALAHERRARGVPALSVNLGPVAAVGLAAASAVRGSSLTRVGFEGMEPARAIEGIDRLLGASLAQGACMAFDLARWRSAMDRAGAVSLFEADGGAGESKAAEPMLADALNAAPPGPPRRAILESTLRNEIADVLRMPAARVPLDRPFKSLGMDSLMALEMRNRLERRTGLALSPTLVWNYPTIVALGNYVAERLQVELDAARAPEPAPAQAAAPGGEGAAKDDVDALLDELENMTDEEARALLAQEGQG